MQFAYLSSFAINLWNFCCQTATNYIKVISVSHMLVSRLLVKKTKISVFFPLKNLRHPELLLILQQIN